jgi:chromosome segregation ATPase
MAKGRLSRAPTSRWDNIVGFYVPWIEPIHIVTARFCPLDENQKFAYKRMFAGSDKFEYSRITSEHHDELAKVNAKWGLDRGDRIAETGARHRSTEEYRRQLTHECSALEKDIESNKAKLHALYMEIHLAERRVKGLTTMIANLEEKKATIESEQKRLADELANGRGNADAIRDRIKKLDIQLQSVITSLADKNTKLDVAVSNETSMRMRSGDAYSAVMR